MLTLAKAKKKKPNDEAPKAASDSDSSSGSDEEVCNHVMLPRGDIRLKLYSTL